MQLNAVLHINNVKNRTSKTFKSYNFALRSNRRYFDIPSINNPICPGSEGSGIFTRLLVDALSGGKTNG